MDGEHQRRIARFLEHRTGGRIYWWLAWFALASCVALVASDVAMWFLLEDYDPISGTISDLAAGRHDGIADAGLAAFAAGVLALAAAFTLRGDPSATSWLVRASLCVIAVSVTAMALVENYSGEGRGLVLHPYLVTLFAAAVAVVLWFAPERGARDGLIMVTRTLAVLWVLGAGTLSFTPESLTGLHERILMIVVVGSVAGAAWRLMQVANRPPPRTTRS